MDDTIMDIAPDTYESVEVSDTTATSEPEKTGKRKAKGMTAHGFRVGSDSAIIVDILVQGGMDRQDINDKVAAAIDPLTRSGRPKNIPSLISGLLARLEDRGYKIESSWRLIAPSDQ